MQVKKGEWPEKISWGLKASIERLWDVGLLNRHGNDYTAVFPDDDEKRDENLIWLPNALVSGTSEGEDSPVKRIRRSGDIWTLRLLVELYHAQNLRDDYGVERRFLYQRFERRKVGERGFYTIWGFKAAKLNLTWDGPFAAHESRQKSEGEVDHPVWDDVTRLEATRIANIRSPPM
jgi:hypothetical protein